MSSWSGNNASFSDSHRGCPCPLVFSSSNPTCECPPKTGSALICKQRLQAWGAEEGGQAALRHRWWGTCSPVTAASTLLPPLGNPKRFNFPLQAFESKYGGRAAMAAIS